MADNTKIEYASATWNPITGCAVTSPGCKHCYAMRLAGGRLQHHPSRRGLTQPSKAGPVWTGEVRFNDAWKFQPLQWRRPRHIFVCAHSDLFADAVPDAWIDLVRPAESPAPHAASVYRDFRRTRRTSKSLILVQPFREPNSLARAPGMGCELGSQAVRVFAVMALAPQHSFLVLTKRPDRLRRYLTDASAYRRVLYAARGARRWRPRLGSIAISDPCYAAWWPQVWLGTTIEDQKRADARRPHLQALAEAGWQTWVSYEPALGPVDWSGWEFLRWLVSGGEYGPKARPSHPDWHRAARDFSAANRIPYHFKHCGAFGDHGPVWGTAAGDCTDLAGCVFVDADGTTHSKREHAAADSRAMRRVGKRAAGRLLDGVEHNAVPPFRGQQYELELEPRPPFTKAPSVEEMRRSSELAAPTHGF